MKTLAQKIEENFLTKKGTVKYNCSDALYLIQNPSRTIRPCSWSRSKGYCNLKDIRMNVRFALLSVGVDFETGNDAPRGGLEGEYIRLTSKGKKQVAKYNANIAKMKAESITKLEAEKAAKLAEKQNEIQKQLEGVDSENVLKSFFANEIHPAPEIVCAAKIASGLSWSALRVIYK
mgnify:CR=1 FL=1